MIDYCNSCNSECLHKENRLQSCSHKRCLIKRHMDDISRNRFWGKTKCEVFSALMQPWAWKIYLSILATQGLKHRSMFYQAIEQKYRTAVLSDFCAILQMERFTLRLEWFRKKGLFFCRGKETESSAPSFVSNLCEESNWHVSLDERIHRLIVQI